MQMKFKLIIFDLDETLLHTEDLERFRGYGNTGNLPDGYRENLTHAASRINRMLINQDCISRIQSIHNGAHIGIFTTSPRTYTETLLEHYYPQTKWDVIVTYEDVKNTKPSPEGIRLASEHVGATWGDQVALIGDSWKDVESAYRAGCWSILFKGSWPINPHEWTKPHYRALRLIPDAVANSEKNLEWIMEKPWIHLPLLEQYCFYDGAPPRDAPTRIETVRHFKDNNSVRTLALGRLFPESAQIAPRRAWHLLSHDILAYKDADYFPTYWIRAIWCAIISKIDMTINNVNAHWIVTSIPHKPGRTPRLESLLQQLADGCPHEHLKGKVDFISNLFSFNTGSRSHHGEHLNADQRFHNIEKNLHVLNASVIPGKHIIVIDDVCTSGATMYHAEAKLREFGPADVTCLSMTQTVSP